MRDNLLGTGSFCPVIKRTPALEMFLSLDLPARAREAVGHAGGHLVARAAGFMLLADSRASFQIEGERPPRNRLERWGRAVLQAGKNKLTLDEIIGLDSLLIEDTRFVQAGLRTDGVFIGDRDHAGDPLPEFIGARAQDLADLMAGLLEANDRMRDDRIDPVLQAAATAFAFVYVHPFEDGNGRLHRCFIHHVLAERRFTPTGMVFPVSSVMLDRIDDYRDTLQAQSRPLMPFIQWRPTPERNVEVLTTQPTFTGTSTARRPPSSSMPVYGAPLKTSCPAKSTTCAATTRPYSASWRPSRSLTRIAEELVMFIRQNNGALPRKRREGTFKELSDEEVRRVESIVVDAFVGFEGAVG